MRLNLRAALSRLPVSLALLAGRFRLTPGLILWLSLPLAAYQAGSLLNHNHSSVAGQGGSALAPATLTVSGASQFNGAVKISSVTLIVDGSGGSISGATITNPILAVAPSNNITGAWVVVSSFTLTTAISGDVAIPSGAVAYWAYFAHSQNTSSGLITLKVNADGGANYSWEDQGLVRASSLGTFSDADTSCAWGGNNSVANVSPAGSVAVREWFFSVVGNNAFGKTLAGFNQLSTTEGSSHGSCGYFGSATPSKLTVTTSAGTLTGVLYLFALK